MNFKILVVLALILIFGGCKKKKVETTHTYTKETVVYKSESGVSANLLSLDIYHFNEKNTLKPVIIYVHGGAWAIGDKSQQLINKTNTFYKEGYLTVSVNYRLSPSPVQLTNPNRIQFPTHNEDVSDAIVWCFNNIAKYGGDPSKIILMGHSAGAHLVSLSGISADFLPKKGIQLNQLKGVISVDTEGYDISTQINEDIYKNAFGSDTANWIKASPQLQLNSTTIYPPFLVIKRGENSRIALANAFIETLKKHSVQVTEITASNYTHAGVNDAIGQENETVVTPGILSFIAKNVQ